MNNVINIDVNEIVCIEYKETFINCKFIFTLKSGRRITIYNEEGLLTALAYKKYKENKQ